MNNFTTSDNIKIAYYIDDATKPWIKPDTILLLHPAMGSARRYFAWISKLSVHYRVLRMDMRGHGASDVPSPDKELSMARLMRDVIELLDQIGCKSVHAVGTSAGGYIAQNLALNHPEYIKSLMLFSSTPGLRNSKWPQWLPYVAKIGLRKWLSENLEGRLPVKQLDPLHIEWFLDEADKLDLGFGGRLVTLMSSLDWSDRLHEISCPTFIARPGAAGIGNECDYDVMQERIPGVQMVDYHGLPHHLTDAVPDRCVSDVLAFLRWRFEAPDA